MESAIELQERITTSRATRTRLEEIITHLMEIETEWQEIKVVYLVAEMMQLGISCMC